MNPILKAVVGASLAVVLVASGFVGGFVVAKSPFSALRTSAVAAQGQPALGEHVEEVYELLRREALKPPSETSATVGAVRGLVESGDPYSTYFDQRHYEYFNQEMSGEFGGVGLSLADKDGHSYVVSVFKGTPAERAGIKPGDRFVAIDDVRRQKWVTEEVVRRVRGEEGTKVKLTMVRPGKEGVPGKEYTVTLTREMITFPNTTSELKGDVGYISVAQFNGNATDEISSAVKALTKKGAASFVLDLRDNPGGSLQQAVSVASLFIDSGVVVRVEERGRPEIEHRTTGQTVTRAPLIVLINENSASASEIVAGALQDYGRAKLVGARSFGKGSVQTIRELSFGGAIKFTTAHYLTPKRRVIDGIGLTPDVVVKMAADDAADEKTDVQLKRALQEARRAR